MSFCCRCKEEFDRVCLVIAMEDGSCHVRCLSRTEREALRSTHYWSTKHLDDLERIEAEANDSSTDRPGARPSLQAIRGGGVDDCGSDAHRHLEQGSTLEEAFRPGTHSLEEVARYQEGCFHFEAEEGDLFQFRRDGEESFLLLTREEVVDLFWEIAKVIGDDPHGFLTGKEGKVKITAEVRV